MEVDLIKTVIFYIENPSNSYALLTIGVLLLAIEFSTPGGFVLGILGSIITAYAFWILGYYTALIFSVIAFVAVVYLGYEAFRLKKQTGKEAMIGQRAVVKKPLDPKGKVLFAGELWNAKSVDGLAISSNEVEIVGKEGLMLIVKETK